MLWRVRKSTGVVQTGGAENSVLPGNTGATGLNVAEKKGCVKTKRDLDRKYCTVLQNNDVETAQNMVYKAKKDKNMSAAETREYAALLKVRRLYEDGLEKLHEGEYAPAGVERKRYQAIKQTPDGQKVVVLDQNVLDQRPNTMKKETFIKNYLVDLARNNPDVFARIEENGHKIYLDDNVLPNEYAYSKSAQNAKGEIKNIRERALSNLDEIIEVGSNRRFEGNRKENLQPKRADKKRGGMYKYDTKIAIPGENGMESFYDATVLIKYDQNGKRYLYDIVGIKKDGSPTTYTSQKSDYRMYEGVPSTNNIPNPAENVNSKSQKNKKKICD